MQGWTLAEQRQTEVGIAQMCQGLAALQVMGIESTRPYNLALLAEAYGKMGKTEGRAALTEALEIVDKTGERYYEAELYRLKGELTLQSKASLGQAQGKSEQVKSQRAKVKNYQTPSPQVETEAKACFHKALDIARRQQAKSLELRAVMSLARLWQQQGKQEEDHQMLSEVYGWFTEGFDTKDLQEAKALLTDLS